MENTSNHVNRYLIAKLLLDSSYRQKLKMMMDDEHRAFAPELGVNLGQVARVGLLLENRDKRYKTISFWIFLISLIIFFSDSIAGFWIYILASLVVYYWKTQQENFHLMKFVSTQYNDTDLLEKELSEKFGARSLNREIPQGEQNLVVYSGFIPFVGSGYDMGGWSFPVNIKKPKESLGAVSELKPFEIEDVYSSIETALFNCELDGLTMQDLLFVNGRQVRDIEWILPSKHSHPVQLVENHFVEEFKQKNDSNIRHYKAIQIFDWGNEIVVSYFLRFSIKGKYLFIEANRFLLTPVAEQYREIDTYLDPKVQDYLKLAVRSLLIGPFAVFGGALSVLNRWLHFIQDKDIFGFRERRKKSKMEREPFYDYGAANSLRVEASDGRYRHFFQKLDKEMYFKILEKEILDSIVSFLDKHNIDISEISQKTDMILNNGLIVQGGEVNAESLAVGTGANSSSTRIGKAMETVGGAISANTPIGRVMGTVSERK